jgi:hypothetical protein
MAEGAVGNAHLAEFVETEESGRDCGDLFSCRDKVVLEGHAGNAKEIHTVEG